MSKQNKSDGEAAYGGYRAGFSVLVGRPNAGKSTLTNALVGQKVAITSAKPQTTRHTIRGIVHRDDAQLILVDTPGLHRPRTLLGKRLNELVADTLAEVDAIGFCLPANEKIGPGDKFIAAQLAAVGNKPIIAIVTKADTVDRQALTEQLLAVAALGREVLGEDGWKDIVPVSATDGFQVETVADVLISHMPLVAAAVSGRPPDGRAGGCDDRRTHPGSRPRRRPRRAAALPGRRRRRDRSA